MARGRFGLRRPFAVEKEQVIISIQTEKEIHEAKLHSLNGDMVAGELRPYFKIDSVEREEPEFEYGDYYIDVYVDTSENMLHMEDITMFLDNIEEETGVDTSPPHVEIVPVITVNRQLAEPDHVGKLVVQFSTSEGTSDEFLEEMETMDEKHAQFSIIGFESGEGTHRAYCESKSRGVRLHTARLFTKEILEPRDEITVDVAFYCIGIEEQ